MKVTRGRTVEAYGPWSNGHMEQAAVVTHVYGEGDEPGVLVNLYVMVDADAPMVCVEIPFYPSRQHALAAMATGEAKHNGGAVVAYWPERV